MRDLRTRHSGQHSGNPHSTTNATSICICKIRKTNYRLRLCVAANLISDFCIGKRFANWVKSCRLLFLRFRTPTQKIRPQIQIDIALEMELQLGFCSLITWRFSPLAPFIHSFIHLIFYFLFLLLWLFPPFTFHINCWRCQDVNVIINYYSKRHLLGGRPLQQP